MISRQLVVRWVAGGPVTALAVALALVAPPAASRAFADQSSAQEGTFERTLKVSGPVDLDITTGSGRIDVRPGAAGEVRIVGRIRASRDWDGARDAEERVKRLTNTPPVEQTGNRIRLGYIDDEELRRNISITFEVATPVATTVRSRTGSGSQQIGDLQGPVHASTGSGRIAIGRIGGDVQASAGSGDIDIGGVQGRLTASTGSGDIRADGVAGAIGANTGSGRIDVAQAAEGSIELSTGSGGIRVRNARGSVKADSGSGSIDVQGTPTGEWRLSSASGSIDVGLPSEGGFELDVRTSSGRIDSVHPVTISGSIDRRHLRGSVRGGGPLILVRTASGSIRIG